VFWVWHAWCQFHQRLHARFSYKSKLSSLSQNMFGFVIFDANISYEKRARNSLMKSTVGLRPKRPLIWAWRNPSLILFCSWNWFQQREDLQRCISTETTLSEVSKSSLKKVPSANFSFPADDQIVTMRGKQILPTRIFMAIVQKISIVSKITIFFFVPKKLDLFKK